MPPNVLPWINLGLALPLAACAGWLLSRRTRVQGTTLVGPWTWAAISLAAWSLAQCAALPALGMPPGWRSRLGYLALTLLLAPFVSVLGAKRPGSRVWDLFIVLPMLLVLNWPAWASDLRDLANSPLELEGPALMGMIVVLIMILGNYFGTIFTGSVLLIGAGLLAGLTAASESLPQLGDGQFLPRMLTSAALLGGLLMAVRAERRTIPQRSGYERVWLDFRDWFGVLWTRRLMDRLNQTAEQEHWVLRVGLDGLHWDAIADEERRRETTARLDHTLRWLFRRFTDDAWIDARLADAAASGETKPHCEPQSTAGSQ